MFRKRQLNQWFAGAGLGLLIALVSPNAAVAAEVVLDPASEQLRTSLGQVQELRVISNGQSLTLKRPIIGIDGISFERVDGWPRPRRALFTSIHDNELAPSNPIAWSDIHRIERPVTRVNPAGVILGAGLGLLAGWYLGPRVAFPVALMTNSIPAFWITRGVIMIGAPVLGAVAMGTSREWERVPYPDSQPHR